MLATSHWARSGLERVATNLREVTIPRIDISRELDIASKALDLSRRLLPLTGMGAKNAHLSQQQREVLTNLGGACARSTESALLLCAYGQLWDAEVLVRSILEGSLKWCYLFLDKDLFASRIEEFSVSLFEIGLLKDHHKLARMSRVIDFSESEWRPYVERMLKPGQEKELSAKYPKLKRQQLEQRWGFTGLIEEMTKANRPDTKMWQATLHSYSLASHIHHMDYTGIPTRRPRSSVPGALRKHAHGPACKSGR